MVKREFGREALLVKRRWMQSGTCVQERRCAETSEPYLHRQRVGRQAEVWGSDLG